MLRLAVLISGRGSNMQAIINCCALPEVAAEVVVVVADRPAPGLVIAKTHAIPHYVIDRTKNTPHQFEAQLATHINDHACDLICLAGFMAVLSPRFCQKFSRRCINIHPSLLPAYKGLDTHRRVLADGATRHGCTLHVVTPVVDEGEILAQAEVEVLADDTEETLAARVLTHEHRLYAEAITDMADKHQRGEALF